MLRLPHTLWVETWLQPGSRFPWCTRRREPVMPSCQKLIRSTRSQHLAVIGDVRITKLQCGVSDISIFPAVDPPLKCKQPVSSPIFPGHTVNSLFVYPLQLEVHSGHTMAVLLKTIFFENLHRLSNSCCVGNSENLRSYFQIVHS